MDSCALDWTHWSEGEPKPRLTEAIRQIGNALLSPAGVLALGNYLRWLPTRFLRQHVKTRTRVHETVKSTFDLQ